MYCLYTYHIFIYILCVYIYVYVCTECILYRLYI